VPVAASDAVLEVRLILEQLRAPLPGGTGRYARELAAALLATRPSDAVLRATVASRRGPDIVLPHPETAIDVDALGVSPKLLARLWERGIGPGVPGHGVVHAPTLLVPPARRHQALVVTVHDVVPWTHPQTLTARGVSFHRRMGARAARDADLIVTPTAAVADQVRRLLTPRAEVAVLSPGVSTLRAPDNETRARLEPRLPRGPFVLFVGTAEPRKGLDVLVQAMALRPLSGVGLAIVGPPGWGDVDVADLAIHAGVSDRVRVLGRLSDSELSAAYDAATVLAMPSRAEGFGLPVIEAMARGLPVVTSDDPALVEVGAGASATAPIGDVVELADALGAVVDDRDLAILMSENGLRRAASFDWKIAGADMWGMYRSLVGG
jgi:glycosyltransferase involved in cell wall biosynthesis